MDPLREVVQSTGPEEMNFWQHHFAVHPHYDPLAACHRVMPCLNVEDRERTARFYIHYMRLPAPLILTCGSVRILFSERFPPLTVPASVMIGLSPVDLELYYYTLCFEGIVRFHVHMTTSEVMGMRMFSVFDPDNNLLTFFNLLPGHTQTGRHC
ncbi:uncharacterized protein F5Z01DRAFT_672958 [Emericellopsis atlantica]|uniref:VOC domain-containing protein n=1 Tax=Emericellopsis atlantica TaxID=2614577 RepID=A0A9P7ZP20_9HYPO|nr:uncharacterized protein F5Z01DRAFT_672958 [Emericellopsis atlantica]KAG9255654.1 hypothetical protein F5Z01DRAFT_672958 [Emericellopsis atlantica]